MDRQRHKAPPSGLPVLPRVARAFPVHEGGGILAKAAEGGDLPKPSLPKGPSGPGTVPKGPTGPGTASSSTYPAEVTLLAPSPEEGGQGPLPDADLAPASAPATASAVEPVAGAAKPASPALSAALSAEPAPAATGAKPVEPPRTELPAKGSSVGGVLGTPKPPQAEGGLAPAAPSPGATAPRAVVSESEATFTPVQSARSESLGRDPSGLPPGDSSAADAVDDSAVSEPDYSAGRSSDEEDRAVAAPATPRPHQFLANVLPGEDVHNLVHDTPSVAELSAEQNEYLTLLARILVADDSLLEEATHAFIRRTGLHPDREVLRSWLVARADAVVNAHPAVQVEGGPVYSLVSSRFRLRVDYVTLTPRAAAEQTALHAARQARGPCITPAKAAAPGPPPVVHGVPPLPTGALPPPSYPKLCSHRCGAQAGARQAEGSAGGAA